MIYHTRKSRKLRHVVPAAATWKVNDASPSFLKKACALAKTLGSNQDLNLQVHFDVYVR
jgi:hypothetical protein